MPHDAGAEGVRDTGGGVRDTGGGVGDTGTSETLDAEGDASHGLLPVDERNPVIIDNDGWSDNWQGEYAVLFANSGGPTLEGIVAGATNYWSDLAANVDGWTGFVTAARASGLQNIPDVTEGASKTLTAPGDGMIDSTVPIGSAGAHLIVNRSRQLSLPARPVVVLTGGALTNVADAYLIDHSVVDRVVVVASLGRYKAPKAVMSGPNGDLDPWADWIVAQRFRYIQFSIDYDQASDVTEDQLPSLPKNPLGDWMAAKQPDLSTLKTAADQVTVLSTGLPTFVRAVQRSSPDTSAGFNSPPGQGPPLVPDATGNAWVVTEIAAPLGPSRLWQVLLDSHTFGS
jgi:hypothetical protein